MSKLRKPRPLAVKTLRWKIKPSDLKFRTTRELDEINQPIGQERAVEAFEYGMAMDHPGYNIFALGPRGIGKHHIINSLLADHSKGSTVPSDWCYVSNFKTHQRPKALKLPPGRGQKLKRDMSRFVEVLRDALRSSFESEEYRNSRQTIEERFKDRQEKAFKEIEEKSLAEGLTLVKTPMGFAFAPISEGKVVSSDVFQQFPESERSRIESKIDVLQVELREAVQNIPIWANEMRDQTKELNSDTATFAVEHLMGSLENEYQDLPEVIAYLNTVHSDIIENVEAIIMPPEKGEENLLGDMDGDDVLLRRYRVNLIVDNSTTKQAPVIYEDDPNFDQIVGRIEHRAEMGVLMTDFLLIRPGALHLANGGCLVLDAYKLLTKPMAWEGLKRLLFAGEIRIESLYRAFGIISTASLEPEPIPLDIKVIIIGENMLYYMLSQLDPEFEHLFKVAADFNERIERTTENCHLYARIIATLARKEKTRPVTRTGVARALEFCVRRAENSERLSTEVNSLAELLREAEYWASKLSKTYIDAEVMKMAETSRLRRLDRVRQRMLEETHNGTLVIDTEGAKTGQINGLSVLQMGEATFGRPCRITARVWAGKQGVVDVEREVKLGGAFHSKGILILSGYLNARYGRSRPLSLGASVVFEQSYGGIDGDSASSAELFALLSEIAEVPISQNFAVTGSVNQLGEVQAIGGVNEKIEGFFELCQLRGLSGDQGVLIPATNVRHLMLGDEVVNAVRAGKFRIYPIETIDQGIAILTGMTAGKRSKAGNFPKGSFNALVDRKLEQMTKVFTRYKLPGKKEF